MRDTFSENNGRNLRGKALLGIVGLGMILFIMGFVIAVSSLSHADSVSTQDDLALHQTGADDSNHSMYLMLGLLLSLAGVVMATTGPAVVFLLKRKDAA